MKKQYSDLYINKKIVKSNVFVDDLPQTKVVIKLWSRQVRLFSRLCRLCFPNTQWKNYKKLIVSEDMIGKKFSEFTISIFITHKKKRTK